MDALSQSAISVKTQTLISSIRVVPTCNQQHGGYGGGSQNDLASSVRLSPKGVLLQNEGADGVHSGRRAMVGSSMEGLRREVAEEGLKRGAREGLGEGSWLMKRGSMTEGKRGLWRALEVGRRDGSKGGLFSGCHVFAKRGVGDGGENSGEGDETNTQEGLSLLPWNYGPVSIIKRDELIGWPQKDQTAPVLTTRGIAKNTKNNVQDFHLETGTVITVECSTGVVGWTTGSGMTGPLTPTMQQQQGEAAVVVVEALETEKLSGRGLSKWAPLQWKSSGGVGGQDLSEGRNLMGRDDAVGLVMRATTGTGWTTGSGLSGPATSTQVGSEEGASSTGDSDSWTPWIGLSTSPRRRMRVKFTCNLCGERTLRAINPHAYREGTVFAQCQGCGVFHKLVDNLNLFRDITGPVFGKPKGDGGSSGKEKDDLKEFLFEKELPYDIFDTWQRLDDSPLF